jgi:betaine-aldehyde dehydrogenase
MGDVFDLTTNFGPLVSEVHHKKVVDYIWHGIHEDKARLLCGGFQKPSNIPKGCENGFWIQPTVFTDCHDAMKITSEEIFGPVMCILTYSTTKEAIARANATPLGLAAGVFTKDLNAAHQIIAQLEAGITWINTWGESPAEMSVGGWKMSGIGVENGKRGLEAWVREKSTLIDMSGKVATVFSKL